ncbi:MAG: peptidylprolyl isomerase [Chloroflexota bacterium]|jgi:FKBP-type peptidyl-prolyl cis-trans isomerase SlyD
MSADKIAKDVVVTFDYRLTLDDGSLVEESDGDPLVYLHGHDNIIPGLERELEGLAVGDKKQIVVEPADAYGEYDAEDVEEIARSVLPSDVKPEVGLELALRDQDGNQLVAWITEFDDETIQIDFNHPMAGERLHFDVTITDLRAASQEEMAHGHVHQGDHHHHH